MTFAPVLSDEVAEALDRSEPVVALETTLVSHGFSGGRGLVAALAAERARPGGGRGAGHGGDRRRRDPGRAWTTPSWSGSPPPGRPPARPGPGTSPRAWCRARSAPPRSAARWRCARRRASASWPPAASAGCTAASPTAWTSPVTCPGSPATQVMVVCSGAKSILDVGATSELLETLGIPVLGWNTPTLPLFYTADGGPAVSAVVSAAAEAAGIAAAHWAAGRPRRAAAGPAARGRPGHRGADRRGGRPGGRRRASPARRSRPPS